MSQIEYMTNRKGEPVRQIHFDEDGCIEAVRLYDEIFDEYLSLDLDSIPESVMQEIEKFVNEIISSESGISNKTLEAV